MSPPFAAGSSLLEEHLGRFRRLRSIHIEASVTVSRPLAAPGILGHGSYSYRAVRQPLHDAFRARCTADPRLGLLADVEYAWDGETFSVSYPGMGVVEETSSLPDQLPTALPNPLFLPLAFMTPRGSACSFCRFDLEDVERAPPEPLPTTGWTASAAQGRLETVLLPWQGPTPAPPGFFRLVFDPAEAGARLVRLEKVVNGEAETRIELADYAEHDDFWFPNRLTVTDYTADGRVMNVFEYTIDVLEVDP